MTTKGDSNTYFLYDDLVRLARNLASDIQRREPIAAIAGVPRSGMLAAVAAAIHLGVPLYEAHIDGLREIGHGRRLDNQQHNGRVLVLEDSLNTGRRFSDIKKRLGNRHIYASVFCTPQAMRIPDYVAMELPLPHWFDWWLWGSKHLIMARIGIDFDGILCGDCPIEDDDDGPRYETFLKYVLPIRHAYPHGVPVIISGRMQKYEELTRQWLHDNRQRAVTLALGPWTTLAERRGKIAEHKAKVCREMKLTAFIESDARQAREICEMAKIPVACPEARTVFQPQKR
jgi:hypothetical protein